MTTIYEQVIIGSGFGGIGMGIRLKQAGRHHFLILEKADSVGGTWRDENLPVPKGLILFSPWVDLTVTRDSHVFRAQRDPMLLPAGLQSCANAYCGKTPHDHPYCSPLFADFTDLPPVLIQVGSDEILYDDAIELHKSLKRSNVVAELQVYDGMWHVFQLHCHQLPEATQAVQDAFRESYFW
ncbi:MAG: alpha/beta hydrolase [Firmicutes bacterium]|nr:alpha/beta hydrolase [Bacillota bacterium]